MFCGASARFLVLAFTSAFLLNGGDSEVLGFDLSDALDDKNDGFIGGGGRSNLKPDERVAKDLRFDLIDSLYKRIERFKRGSGKPNQNVKLDLRTTTKPILKKPDSEVLGFDLSDALDLRTTTKPPLKKTDSKVLGFDLSDALDDKNDGFTGGGGRSDLKPDEKLTDKDLEDIISGGYKPDKGKGDGRYDSNDDPGTEGVNTDYVKGQTLEGVTTEEPQVKYSALQTQSAEKSSQETPKI
ncbi:CD99 antigen-like protein 2 isoform X2 [Notamacropus eugenii]|uniref:CD99 antigen-like protein 2 isoform X2 n=1 Tax=Notamacropus eugenii TaxID=9315 RepID=UPI003B6831C6